MRGVLGCGPVCMLLCLTPSVLGSSALHSLLALLPLACSCPADDPSRKKLGAFLVQSQLQGSVHSSAMFLTAAAQNLLCMKLASEMGVAMPGPWLTWVKVRRAAP